LSDSQATSYFNQLLIIFEQFAKQDNFKTKTTRKYNKLKTKNTMYMQLMNWLGIETNWSKWNCENLIQGVRPILTKKNLDQNQFIFYQLINLSINNYQN